MGVIAKLEGKWNYWVKISFVAASKWSYGTENWDKLEELRGASDFLVEWHDER